MKTENDGLKKIKDMQQSVKIGIGKRNYDFYNLYDQPNLISYNFFPSLSLSIPLSLSLSSSLILSHPLCRQLRYANEHPIISAFCHSLAG